MNEQHGAVQCTVWFSRRMAASYINGRKAGARGRGCGSQLIDTISLECNGLALGQIAQHFVIFTAAVSGSPHRCLISNNVICLLHSLLPSCWRCLRHIYCGGLLQIFLYCVLQHSASIILYRLKLVRVFHVDVQITVQKAGLTS